MTDSHEVRRFRTAFLVALTSAVGFAIVAGALWWRLDRSHSAPMAQTAPPAAASTSMPMSEGNATVQSPAASGNEQLTEAPLAPIQLTSLRMQSIGVQVGTVESRVVDDELRFSGNVQVDERRLAYVQTRFAGWIRALYADATGDFVRKGQPLFTIYSPDLMATQQEYLLAKKNRAAMQQSSVDGVAAGAASLFDAARARLLQWDIPEGEIAKLDTTGKAISDLTINSPVSGYITEKNALPNMFVQPETKLYTIADLSDVWVSAQVFQNDVGRIKPGDLATVTVDAYPGRVFSGRVDYILPQMDVTTRTLPVRFVLQNPDLKLRPGMYVNILANLPLGRHVVVAASAVFHTGTRNLVFLYRDGGNILPREVELGPSVKDGFIVLEGLKAGDRIITSANFLIDSEAQLQAAAGAFGPPPPGAGAAAAMNAPAQTEAMIDLTTDPTPPQKGSNTIRVRLTAPDGKPISGAQVTVALFMPAMPAMGMAAMNTVIHADDKGGGFYEGKGQLGSGGTWQVTVTALQNGQSVASKHLTLNATGGM
jgi:Cu(I)/Ag(I) efflux system membrane fusion protein/cobalt-zinc-cadmium efflux system membrane fusion protein